jgi:hypothetical protein
LPAPVGWNGPCLLPGILLSPVLRILKKNGRSCAILIRLHPQGPRYAWVDSKDSCEGSNQGMLVGAMVSINRLYNFSLSVEWYHAPGIVRLDVAAEELGEYEGWS